MIKTFCIGTKKRKYRGIAIRIGWFKVELIRFKDKFNFTIEVSNWRNE